MKKHLYTFLGIWTTEHAVLGVYQKKVKKIVIYVEHHYYICACVKK